MLAALLHDRLDAHLTRPPGEIPELLTSLILGSCRYAPPGAALLPFLGRALCPGSQERLGAELAGVDEAVYHFWPAWPEGGPDLLLQLRRPGRPDGWLALAGRLYALGAAPGPAGPSPGEELAQCWGELQRWAEHEGGEALGVVVVSAHATFPGDLLAAGEQPRLSSPGAPVVYWLSWRTFAEAVADDAPALLVDVATLLRRRYHLVAPEPGTWPAAVSPGPAWRLELGVRSPPPGPRPAWAMSWSWPVPWPAAAVPWTCAAGAVPEESHVS
jgi:hypothetical protein